MKKTMLNESEIPEGYMDPYIAEQQLAKNIKIKINMAKMTLPITSALFEGPGMDASDQYLSDSISTMLEKTRDITQQVLEHFNLNQNGYYFGLLGERAAEIVAEGWKNGYKNLDTKTLSNMLISYIDTIEPTPENVFSGAPRATDEALQWGIVMDRCTATFDVIRPFTEKSREMWLGNKSLDEFILLIRESIKEDVDKAMKIYACDSFGEDDALKFRLGFMKTIGRVYASALFSEVNKQLSDIKSMSKEQRTEHHKTSMEVENGFLFEAAHHHIQRNLDIVYPELNMQQNTDEQHTLN
ncbi:hypothetical protein Q9L42_021070 (plasmid) [Methylomarinum sp. Ch1-1]|uniref:Uncharacterized protein n=1 Tax=Methylomarinum roseum TaxID=3067653 RepID=A0AAU7P0I6_9GAMM|nr:hypothetical protein [Methylomarinum sp. Ch1-1]MDP4523146.1 hypothetical protein [Methylomarinum sp. Ch1-1]